MKAPAALRDQQRVLAPGADERGPAALEVAAEGDLRGLPHRHQARLSALALDREALSPSKSGESVLEVDDLLGPQAAGVGELQHGAIAHLEGRSGRDPVEQSLHLVAAQDARELAVALGRRDQVGRVGGISPARMSAP